MLLPSKHSFSPRGSPRESPRKSPRGSPRGSPRESIFGVRFSVFLPNSQSFYFTRSTNLKPLTQSNHQEPATNLASAISLDAGEPIISVFLPNSQSFYFTRTATLKPVIQPDVQEITTSPTSDTPLGANEPTVSDKNKRQFLKVAGVAGVSLGASLLFPKKAQAFILGSSPTTGVVGLKDSTNARINPATEETLDEVLKTSDLTFDGGALEVKIASVSGAGTSSFSDSGNVARSALVDVDRHVQVDVLSSALPTSASTETTLETISFGGFKFTLRLDTVGDVDYIGEANIGTATSASSWRVKKVDSSSGLIVQWAGTGVFDQVWDNRASLTYS